MRKNSAWQLVERQAQAWTEADIETIVADFTADGILISPGGSWQGEAALRAAVGAFWQSVQRVEVTVTNAFLCGNQGAAEWTWTETRHDGSVHTAEDGIIFTLRNGKIAYWREYFDTNNF